MSNEETSPAKKKDVWDKLAVLGTLTSGIAIPLAVVYIGSNLNDSIKASENKLKYIEIATSLIREEPKDENQALRAWAIDVLAHFSKDVPMSEAAQTELKKRRTSIYTGGWDNTTVDVGSGFAASASDAKPSQSESTTTK